MPGRLRIFIRNEAKPMIRRERYLKQLRPFYDSDLVKIVTGIRRCGKSVILRQVMEELQAAGKKCLFLDFDMRPTRVKLPDADTLWEALNIDNESERLAFVNSGFRYLERTPGDTPEHTLRIIEEHF